MHSTYEYRQFPYVCSPEQRDRRLARHPVIVVGAGPVGLTAALDLAARGVDVVLLDDDNAVSVGSRAVCLAKRPLEIWDRLGCATPLLDKGVRWNLGRVFLRGRECYRFDLLPEPAHKMPAMINLQQYYLEDYLIDACLRTGRVDLRWKHRVVALRQMDDGVELDVETPDGVFTMRADWVIACDGAHSALRGMVGASFTGQVFHDRFLIADVVMQADYPAERWFWFDPPFHPGQSVLLHKQADHVWRIDFQLGPDADPEAERQPARVIPRLRAMLGPDRPFELEWVSIYQFACRRIDRFRHGRVLFAGDAAHQVSPFGARGANTGVQDADNLAWKLALVLDGAAHERLLDSYETERGEAADENLLASTRSTDFISPKSDASRRFRDAVLELSAEHEFARPLVNSGRLSVPTRYTTSAHLTPDTADFAGTMHPGSNCADAPVRVAGRDGWFLELLGAGFTVLVFGPAPAAAMAHGRVRARLLRVGIDLEDPQGLLAARYDGRPGTVYLIRPDQYVAARWREFDQAAIAAALSRAIVA